MHNTPNFSNRKKWEELGAIGPIEVSIFQFRFCRLPANTLYITDQVWDLGELDGEELGHAGPEAVSGDDEAVGRPLLEAGGERVEQPAEDVGGGGRHALVRLALVPGGVLAVEVHQDVRHARHREHLNSGHAEQEAKCSILLCEPLGP